MDLISAFSRWSEGSPTLSLSYIIFILGFDEKDWWTTLIECQLLLCDVISYFLSILGQHNSCPPFDAFDDLEFALAKCLSWYFLPPIHTCYFWLRFDFKGVMWSLCSRSARYFYHGDTPSFLVPKYVKPQEPKRSQKKPKELKRTEQNQR